ncbi:hypothetical protein [Planomonospora venezuelensis]|uniref:Uncharacterized protein n=1 Tax=Planomonospora venezuelensis TaxID=1999 RepID=A0A841D8X7_PLAVE|nr:hypothetical protein [Planomonospora venezuelensis]MBB5965047.1 hypothetical protein [Planomonospora venezuelensis]GIN05036.1 hypothetical protein Pve01_66940 [Planomonospora venezuelensis]
MASGLYISTLADIFDATQLALDWDAEDHQAALYTSSKSPNYNDDTVYSSTNEISGTGYTAGGLAITGTATSKPGAGVLKWTSNAFQWTGSTLSDVKHIDIYAAAVSGDPLMIGIMLASAVNTSDGTLLITPHANGLLTIDGTP